MAKYTTYTELSEAFKSGELGHGYHLQLDKGGDSNVLNFYDALLSDQENEQRQEACAEIFQFDRNSNELPIEALLTLVGIPFEWC